MLSGEWRELEELCQRISKLRHRYSAALNTRNVGLLEGLREDLTVATRQRELLLQHISARLGAAAAGEPQAPERKPAPAFAAAPPPRAANPSRTVYCLAI